MKYREAVCHCEQKRVRKQAGEWAYFLPCVRVLSWHSQRVGGGVMWKYGVQKALAPSGSPWAPPQSSAAITRFLFKQIHFCELNFFFDSRDKGKGVRFSVICLFGFCMNRLHKCRLSWTDCFLNIIHFISGWKYFVFMTDHKRKIEISYEEFVFRFLSTHTRGDSTRTITRNLLLTWERASSPPVKQVMHFYSVKGNFGNLCSGFWGKCEYIVFV